VHSLRPVSILLMSATLGPLPFSGRPLLAQTSRTRPDSALAWVGERIIMLHGMGAVHRAGDSSHVTTAVGINLVAPVVRVDGRRLWFVATSGDDSGWVDSAGVLRLSQGIPYFGALIARDSSAWDPYLRRAEAEHALNQRAAATADYTQAIRLHPREAFLYLRRGRHYMTLHACDEALADFQAAATLAPTSAPQGYNLTAELYSLESGVYSGCPDTARRDSRRALATIRQAIALDSTRASFFVILAGAYASAGDLRAAVTAQRRALAARRAAPSYRDEWRHQLETYERALDRRGRQ
jgi:tetratricopeptide (TPR) repeat protein